MLIVVRVSLTITAYVPARVPVVVRRSDDRRGVVDGGAVPEPVRVRAEPERVAEDRKRITATTLNAKIVETAYAISASSAPTTPDTAAIAEAPQIPVHTTISTSAVVFAGTTIGENVVVGDLASVRERCAIGDDVVLGRGVFVENDSEVGARTKIQAHSYITAYSTLEEDVFMACSIATTNDNFMGRSEERFELVRGPTIKRGARIGGGVVLCPGVVVGEEAYIGAGTVVIEDVPERMVVVGNPARVIRPVDGRELLDDES